MLDAARHADRVDAWLRRSGKDRSPEALLELFEAGFGALWARATITLGEVTLTAIAERVLYNASEKFPLLSSLEVEPTGGIRCGALRARIGAVPEPRAEGSDPLRAGGVPHRARPPDRRDPHARAALGARQHRTAEDQGRGQGAMTKKTEIARVQTGIRNLDALLDGGLPKGSVTVVAGAPGSGKTILTQQICFHNASARDRVLYFSTLSEPIAKTLQHLRQFSFFDPRKVGGRGRVRGPRRDAADQGARGGRSGSSCSTSRGSSRPSWSSTASRSSTISPRRGRSSASSSTRSPST